jgi:organic radical activating enzyme
MNKDITNFQQELNAVSPSFCIAKWKQVTLHLQTGHNHSCHHPTTHKIPLDELAANPGALHNTNFKKAQRKQMLAGQRPSECDYCWRVEDSGTDAISDRVYKSSDSWARKYLTEVAESPWDFDHAPSYLEVSFSSVCNFRCSYCSPEVSSKWMEESERYGAYPTSTGFGDIEWLKNSNKMPIPHSAHNPYVDAFWEWWPSIYQTLEHFRITGGEPLLAKDTFKVLDYIIENPNPALDLSINSNMCVPDQVLDKFIEKIKIICAEGKVKRFKIFTSCDAHGKAAEYIRDGMDYDKWLLNIQKVLDAVPECTFTIMSTYNALSVGSYMKFLEDVVKIKHKYGGPDGRSSPLILDTPYLRWPQHQAIFILPNSWADRVKDQVTYAYQNLENPQWMGTANRGFYTWEADKFKRIYELLLTKQDIGDAVTQHHKDFVAFVDEHDRRRGTDFLATFPEYSELYHHWRNNPISFNHDQQN